MQIIETVKAHPYATGGIVLGVGALIIFMSSGGDDDSGSVYDGGYTVSGPSDAQVAAGVALQAGQMELAAHREDTAAQLRVAELTAGSAIRAEEIKAGSAFDLAAMATDLQRFNITKSAEVSNNQSFLTAAVAEKSIGLETLRVNEASKNTQIQVAANKQIALTQTAAAKDIAIYDRTLDFKTDQKQLNVAKKVATKQLNVTKKLGTKQLNVQKKLGVVGAGVAKDAATKGLIGGIVGGIFNLAGTVVSKGANAASNKTVKKTNTAAKSSYMPVETKKKKGKK